MIYILIFMKTVYWIQNFERRIPSVSVLDHPVHGPVLPDFGYKPTQTAKELS